VHLAGGDGALERLAIRLGDHEHGTGASVLRYDGDDAVALGEIEGG
jgi:hypothetical protein